MDQRLLAAITNNNTAAAVQLIGQGLDVNACDWNGMTALMWAALYDRRETMEALLRAGARVEAKDSNGWSAWRYAWAAGSPAGMDLLRSLAGADQDPQAAGPAPAGMTNEDVVIVIDDRTNYCDALEEIVRALPGALVWKACEGIIALKLADRLRPAIIVTDMNMPGLTGEEIYQNLRVFPWAAKCRFVFMSGSGPEDDIPGVSVKAPAIPPVTREGERRYFLRKPFLPPDVHRALGEAGFIHTPAPKPPAADRPGGPEPAQVWTPAAGLTGNDLLRAAAAGDALKVQQALAAGVTPDQLDSKGRSPLMYAVQRGHLEAARLLIEGGADMERKEPGGDNVLFFAIRGRRPEAVEFLLMAGADPNARERHGAPALTEAVAQPEILSVLLSFKADPNAQGYLGETALMRAARLGNIDVVGRLLAGGADPALRNRDGRTALLIAYACAQMQAAQLLESRQTAAQSGGDGPRRQEALEKGLLESARRGDSQAAGRILGLLPSLQPLSREGAVVASCDVRDDLGLTPLLIACEVGAAPIVELLLQAGADPEAKDNKGRTALAIAKDSGFEEGIRLLSAWRSPPAPTPAERKPPAATIQSAPKFSLPELSWFSRLSVLRYAAPGRLAYKFLFVCLLASLVPLGVAGYYIVNLNRIALSRTISRDQEALVVGFADTVSSYIINFKNVLADTARLESFSSMNMYRQQSHIYHTMQLHAAFLEISVIDAGGQETVHVGRFGQDNKLRDFTSDVIFNKALKSGEFIGGPERYRGAYPAVTMGVRIVNPADNQAVGVVIAKISLAGISSILKTGFPEATHVQAAIIDSNGFLIAHSNPKEMAKADAKLPDDVLKILLHNDAKAGGGEITLNNGEKVLGAFAELSELGWVAYIQRPVSVAYQASNEMLTRTWHMMFMTAIFVLLFGYIVSLVLTRPIWALREAVIKLGEGNFDYLPDLSMPDDEIGELARTFLQMSESLKIKTAELTSVKEEQVRLNRSLENRVEARTRELRNAQDEMIKQARLSAIGQMAAVVGHEIRNPMGVIGNSVYSIDIWLKKSCAESGYPMDPKIIKHISIVMGERQYAENIIEEMLAFVRTRNLNCKLICLNSYLDDLLMSFPRPAHIELVKELAPENPVVNIDTDEMAHAIRNLLKNGIEVMPELGPLIVRTELIGDMVRLDVEDTGPGISKEMQEKIFAPFFTTKARGMGLGLAVVRKVVDRHKGRVEVASTVGKGACFRLFLPIVHSNPA